MEKIIARSQIFECFPEAKNGKRNEEIPDHRTSFPKN